MFVFSSFKIKGLVELVELQWGTLYFLTPKLLIQFELITQITFFLITQIFRNESKTFLLTSNLFIYTRIATLVGTYCDFCSSFVGRIQWFLFPSYI